MDPSNTAKQVEPEVPRFLDFPHLAEGTTRNGKPALNRFSAMITQGHNFPGAQVLLKLARACNIIEHVSTGNALRSRCPKRRSYEE